MSLRSQPIGPQVAISFQLGEDMAKRARIAAAVNDESRSSLFRRAVVTEVHRLEASQGRVAPGAHVEHVEPVSDVEPVSEMDILRASS